MVTQTLALLLDSYRELNSKKMFWISLILSGVVVVAFAMVGLDNETIYILGFKTPFHFEVLAYLDRPMFYKFLFVSLGVRYWLTVLASVLALISTAGIFPDLIANGSIDLYLSKPISRLRLFSVKYVGGLLFASMQVSIFTVGCFFLLGFRGHSWEPSVFMAIPAVVLIYSYLFCVCVLLGVLTRSTIASLLLTLLLWLCLWSVKFTENITQLMMVRNDLRIGILDRQIPFAQARLAKLTVSTRPAATQPNADEQSAIAAFFGGGRPESREDLQNRIAMMEADDADCKTSSLHTVDRVLLAVMTPLPKTDGTTDLLERYLVRTAGLPDEPASNATVDRDTRQNRRGRYEPTEQAMARALEAENSRRTATWMIGTSLAFELVMCVWAAWVFCRRDY